MLLLSSSSGRQNALKMEIQLEKGKGIYWDKLGQIGKGSRNQYFIKLSLINDLDSYEVPNKQTVNPANVTSAKQC